MTSLRVAVFTDRFPPNWGGGVATAHYQIFRLLTKHGFTVRAFACFDEGAGPGHNSTIIRRRSPRWAIRTTRRAAQLAFAAIEPGRAAYQTADVGVRAWGALALRRALLDFAPDIAIFPDHGAPALFLPTRPECRRVLVLHHDPMRFTDLPLVEPHSRLDARTAAAATQRLLTSIDRTVAPSAYMDGVFTETYRFAGARAIAPLVIDDSYLAAIQPLDPRPRLGLDPTAPLVYVPGGGNKFKGASLVPDILTTLGRRSQGPAGVYLSGAVTAETRRRLASLPDSIRLHLPGPVDGPTNLAIVRTCSFGVYPTLTENYSMALLEAALLGVPMVTFDVGGNGEIVRNGVNGFLAPAYDVGVMTDYAASLLDPAALGHMATTTRADALARLSEAACGQRLVDSLTRFDGDDCSPA